MSKNLKKIKMNEGDIMRGLMDDMSIEKIIERDKKYNLKHYALILENEIPNQMVFEDVVLEEGLIRTYPIDKTLAYLNRCIQTPLIQAKIIQCGNGVQGIQVSYQEYGDNKKVITEILEYCGFYYSYEKEPYELNGYTFCTAVFEPKFEKSLANIRNEEIILYHITHTSNEQRILKQGFTPHDNGTRMTYPPRIFFGRGSDGKQATLYMGVNLYKKRIEKYNEEDLKRSAKDPRRNNQYTLFTINVSKIPEKVKFYGDPGSFTGVWTNDNIPPKCITGVEQYEFDYDKSDDSIKIIKK